MLRAFRTSSTSLRGSKLVRRLFVLQVVTVLLTVGGLTALGVYGAGELEHDAAGRLTRATALSIASDPEVVDALRAGGDVATLSSRLQPVAERVRTATNTNFVVVMSPAGIRYSHYNPAEIGLPYQGNIAPALEGRTATEVYTGTLGPSVRTVTPVVEDGRLIAVVSVGVLQTRVSDLALRWLPGIVVAAGVALLLGLGLAVLLARRLRRQTLGLEPEEIAGAYTHHDAVLHAVGEGLLVVDGSGRLVVVNAEARRLLASPVPIEGGPDTAEPGRPLTGLGIDPAVLAVLVRGLREDLRDEPALAGERVLLVNSRHAGPAAGPGTRVFTLRDRTELAGALRERDDARGKVDALSGQAHEFANRLQTVLTLIELGDTSDATAAGTAALDRTRGPGSAVVAEVLDPVLAALLADKAWQAVERDVAFSVTDVCDPDTLPDLHLPFAADDLVSLAGNLVDNALEVVAAQPRGAERSLTATVRTDGGEVVLEVADSGPGVPQETARELFTFGFSTRATPGGRPRGIGLALVDRITRRLGGTVTVGPRDDGTGAVFTVRLPLPTPPPLDEGRSAVARP
ncbi:two-component system sensor kinase [Pseudonocardia sp. Ae168_Ps1]|uniref:sensor histidine kinase n=1 Tax=unclassified Pseudonocardia TaxID=2619320 RepID=UPI0009670E1E|nr:MULTISPECIES: ATP-binding protein [unclassified Pseudonocardia]OLL76715.1 two-component system sensor kinase [Pseudonocardia sp. Ae150A_Ps1]OLL82727.1 two-component system sensor kinase [Pseudonocardia sp. Ae168_Ps1]OLL83160.1 two-component system sensor kinase [Pseudonocardia sp. Ae263_Ps1]OLL90802.1 two-component system sensor kinase [Pseudonocardia sp. Ae356_Ps1]